MADVKAKHPVPVWGFFLMLIVMAAGGMWLAGTQAFWAWLLVLALMLAFVIAEGYNLKGVPRGFLIDARRKISLSRLQMLAWTLLVLSAYLVAVMINIRINAPDPLAVAIPAELWILMGISTTSLIGSPLLLNDRVARSKTVSPKKELLSKNDDDRKSSWRDLFCGEDKDNNDFLDISRVQMFYFTFILVLTYAYTIGAEMLSISARSLWSRTNTGEIPSVRIGRSVRYDPEDLKAWVKKKKQE